MADTVSAYFKNMPRLNKTQTEKQGRPIYDDFVVCEMRIPGDTNRVVVQPADAKKWIDGPGGVRIQQSFKERFADQWKQYEQNLPQTVNGTPLSELPFLTEGKRKSFRAVGVLTAEQLASLEGTQLKALGQDGRDYKEQAQKYLDLAAGVTDNAALKQQVEDQAKLIADMQQQLARFDHDGNGKTGGGVPAGATVDGALTNNGLTPPANMPDDRKDRLPSSGPATATPDMSTGANATEFKEGSSASKASPFDEYEAEDIKLWLADAAPDLTIDGRWGKPKLVEVADEVNAKLAKGKRVA